MLDRPEGSQSQQNPDSSSAGASNERRAISNPVVANTDKLVSESQTGATNLSAIPEHLPSGFPDTRVSISTRTPTNEPPPPKIF